MRWGIISTADINRLVIPPAQASAKVDLVAVASRTQARADEYAREWGIPRAYGSYEALLDDPEIEAVYISLPNTMHCEWSIRAARGRQARPLREADGQQSGQGRRTPSTPPSGRAAPRGGVHVAPQPADEAARELLDDGAIGELRVVRSCFSYGLYDEDNIRLRTDVEGGA